MVDLPLSKDIAYAKAAPAMTLARYPRVGTMSGTPLYDVTAGFPAPKAINDAKSPEDVVQIVQDVAEPMLVVAELSVPVALLAWKSLGICRLKGRPEQTW